jgi:hypothetical protein
VCVMTYLSVEYGTFVSRQLKISNMAMARNFEVLFHKFQALGGYMTS